MGVRFLSSVRLLLDFPYELLAQMNTHTGGQRTQFLKPILVANAELAEASFG